MLDLPTRRESASETAGPTAPLLTDARPAHAARWPHGFGLAGRVLVVTLGFVLAAMGLFYVTRLAAFRETWLHNKLVSAQTAFEAFDAGRPNELPAESVAQDPRQRRRQVDRGLPHPPDGARSLRPARPSPPKSPWISTRRPSPTASGRRSRPCSPSRAPSFTSPTDRRRRKPASPSPSTRRRSRRRCGGFRARFSTSPS